MIQFIVERKVTMKMYLNCSIIAMSLFFISCGTMQNYPGAKLPKTDVATIKAEYQLLGNLTILSVDNKNLGLEMNKSEVLPGLHAVGLGWGKRGIGFAAYRTLNLDAKAGQVYILRGGNFITKGGMFFWIENEGSGEVVSGKKP